MKNCSKCGMVVNDPDARFCEKCGVALVDSNEYTEKQKSKMSCFRTCLIICAVLIPFIAIYAAIAIPNFLKFQAKSKQSESRSILTGIYEAELAYFATENKFSTNLKEIGFEHHSTPKYYKFKIIYADKDGYIARTWGNIDKDDKIDIWEGTDEFREPVCIYDDVSDTGKEIDPLQLR